MSEVRYTIALRSIIRISFRIGSSTHFRPFYPFLFYYFNFIFQRLFEITLIILFSDIVASKRDNTR